MRDRRQRGLAIARRGKPGRETIAIGRGQHEHERKDAELGDQHQAPRRAHDILHGRARDEHVVDDTGHDDRTDDERAGRRERDRRVAQQPRLSGRLAAGPDRQQQQRHQGADPRARSQQMRDIGRQVDGASPTVVHHAVPRPGEGRERERAERGDRPGPAPQDQHGDQGQRKRHLSGDRRAANRHLCKKGPHDGRVHDERRRAGHGRHHRQESQDGQQQAHDDGDRHEGTEAPVQSIVHRLQPRPEQRHAEDQHQGDVQAGPRGDRHPGVHGFTSP
ncbi:hypothetical protein KCV01_g15532, partial [Aureobasidium melanogenum]